MKKICTVVCLLSLLTSASSSFSFGRRRAAFMFVLVGTQIELRQRRVARRILSIPQLPLTTMNFQEKLDLDPPTSPFPSETCKQKFPEGLNLNLDLSVLVVGVWPPESIERPQQ